MILPYDANPCRMEFSERTGILVSFSPACRLFATCNRLRPANLNGITNARCYVRVP
jgi:hypothetical protein